jgi:hypothetical protein
MVDGLWICNQPVMSRQQAKPAGINPGKVTLDSCFMREDVTFQTNFSTSVNLCVWVPKDLVRKKLKIKLYTLKETLNF